ncbi:hypothetical protein PF008_g20104 [Phytophthora fragariae]|uniref:Pirin-like protein n=1 Tax=Phytophthora fragariae TaxID=53985 RepID=A0A6G0R1J6_9STRA|nr:hypothetical protein PF008_g20104 [Phytophthora fragariae]
MRRELVEEGGVSATLKATLDDTTVGDKTYKSFLMHADETFDQWPESMRYRVWFTWDDAITILKGEHPEMAAIVERAHEVAKLHTSASDGEISSLKRRLFTPFANSPRPSQNLFESSSSSSTFSSVTDNMFNTRRIAFKFVAREQGEGVGATVRRSLGSQQLRNLDPFLMLDEFNVGLPGGFPDHPHRGFETVTYMLPTSKGHMRHEDFLGNKGELRPGDLQWMTPGRGILHAEMPANEEKAHGLQLWINLPKAKKIMEPRYQEISRDTVPHVWDDAKKGAKLEYKIPDGHNAFVYTLTGKGKCAGEDVEAHHAIVLEQNGDGVHVTTDEEDGLEFIVISGQPLNEPVVQYGPFVMTSEEEIHQTIRDYQSGANGFENAPKWTSEIGNRRGISTSKW